MARPSPLAQANRATAGEVHRKLRRWRARGLSSQAIAYRLHDQHQLDVDASTIRRYLKRLP